MVILVPCMLVYGFASVAKRGNLLFSDTFSYKQSIFLPLLSTFIIIIFLSKFIVIKALLVIDVE